MGLVVVLENLDGTVVAEALKLVEALQIDLPGGAMYCSQGPWEAARDLEYFFPHLADLPLERTLALIKPDGVAAGRVEGQTLEEMVEAVAADNGLLVSGKRQTSIQALVDWLVGC